MFYCCSPMTRPIFQSNLRMDAENRTANLRKQIVGRIRLKPDRALGFAPSLFGSWPVR